MDQVIKVESLTLNVTPTAFHRYATEYYQCKHDYKSPYPFSPVPYFLLCRAIELDLKARHLRQKTQPQVKKDYGHNLMASYKALAKNEQILNKDELAVLEKANGIYKSKTFEYFEVQDAMTGYKRFPDLELLDAVAKKLLDAQIEYGLSP